MKPWFVLLCRLAVGGIFIYASWDKLLHPGGFAQAVHHYRLLPSILLHPFAHYLPVLEALIGLALVLGVLRRGAALIAGALTLIFMVAIAVSLARGLDISCGCFHTDGGHGVGLDLLLRDTVLFALCLPPLLAAQGGPALEKLRRR